ncbi:hypothetical protein SRABI83_02636 [Arthrobacter sp. Bi83]|nr:hypothetical protein SRABI83_02636 [Arthrobacter sp. Bi83]
MPCREAVRSGTLSLGRQALAIRRLIFDWDSADELSGELSVSVASGGTATFPTITVTERPILSGILTLLESVHWMNVVRRTPTVASTIVERFVGDSEGRCRQIVEISRASRPWAPGSHVTTTERRVGITPHKEAGDPKNRLAGVAEYRPSLTTLPLTTFPDYLVSTAAHNVSSAILPTSFHVKHERVRWCPVRRIERWANVGSLSSIRTGSAKGPADITRLGWLHGSEARSVGYVWKRDLWRDQLSGFLTSQVPASQRWRLDNAQYGAGQQRPDCLAVFSNFGRDLRDRPSSVSTKTSAATIRMSIATKDIVALPPTEGSSACLPGQ